MLIREEITDRSTIRKEDSACGKVGKRWFTTYRTTVSNRVIKSSLFFITSTPGEICIFLPCHYQIRCAKWKLFHSSQLSVEQLTDNEISDTALKLDTSQRNAIFEVSRDPVLIHCDKTVSSWHTECKSGSVSEARAG